MIQGKNGFTDLGKMFLFKHYAIEVSALSPMFAVGLLFFRIVFIYDFG